MTEEKRSLGQMLDYLEVEGHLDAARRLSAEKRFGAPEAADSHWAIQALLGAGAWVAGFFLIVCVLVWYEFRLTPDDLILIGTALAFAGATLGHLGPNSFSRQLARALMLAGQLFLIAGCGWRHQDPSAAACAALACCVASHVLQPDRVIRFCSTGLMIRIVSAWLLGESRAWMGPLVGVSAGFAALFFTLDTAPDVLRPAAYAAAFALPVLLFDPGAGRHPPQLPPPYFECGVLFLALVLAIFAARRELKASVDERLWIAIGGAGLLAVLGAPGLLAGPLFLVLGRNRQDRVLIALGHVTLLWFLPRYFLDLPISEAALAGVLTASGVLLLAGRSYLLARPWARGGAR